MNKAIFIFAMLLIGCGGDNQNNHGYGFNYDDQHAGTRVRYADGGPADPTASTTALWFQQTIECADEIGTAELSGVYVPAPLVIVVPPGTVDPFDGLIYYDTGTVLIERQWSQDRGLYVHEFVHWLLYNRGAPFDDNHGHIAPEFACRWR